MKALGIDLGPLPERELDPPDPGVADRIYDEAEAEIKNEARFLSWWIALFDDAENVDEVDVIALAAAMHNVYLGYDDDAINVLREAANSTIAALSTEEAKERLDDLDADDRMEALREDHDEWLQDR